jgi:homoserine acetyltransferase
MEMTELWKANIRLSKAPWKSRRRREIPTFPQLRRRVVLLERKRTQKEKTEGRLHKKLDTALRGTLSVVPVLWVNSADDFINSPELGIAQQDASRTPNARFILLPITPETHGHLTFNYAAVWKQYLTELLNR